MLMGPNNNANQRMINVIGGSDIVILAPRHIKSGSNYTNQTAEIYADGTSANVVVVSPHLINQGSISLNGQNSFVLNNGEMQTPLVIGIESTATVSNNYVAHSSKWRSSYWDGATNQDDFWSWQPSLGAGANPSTNLVLTHNGTSGSEIVTISVGNSGHSGTLGLSQAFAATGGANVNSPSLAFTARYFNGSSLSDIWNEQVVMGSGRTPSSGIQWSHSGSSGAIHYKLPSTCTLWWSTDTGLSRTSAGVLALGNGTQGDTSGELDANILNAVTGLRISGGATSGRPKILLATYPVGGVNKDEREVRAQTHPSRFQNLCHGRRSHEHESKDFGRSSRAEYGAFIIRFRRSTCKTISMNIPTDTIGGIREI